MSLFYVKKNGNEEKISKPKKKKNFHGLRFGFPAKVEKLLLLLLQPQTSTQQIAVIGRKFYWFQRKDVGWSEEDDRAKHNHHNYLVTSIYMH